MVCRQAILGQKLGLPSMQLQLPSLQIMVLLQLESTLSSS